MGIAFRIILLIWRDENFFSTRASALVYKCSEDLRLDLIHLERIGLSIMRIECLQLRF
jgi:hypothetical protein